MAEEASRVRIKIKAQDGTFVHFNVNPNIVMKEIFKSYCTKKHMMDYKIFRFFIDGKRLSPRKTVNELGIQDGDEIDAMLHQNGGGPAYYY